MVNRDLSCFVLPSRRIGGRDGIRVRLNDGLSLLMQANDKGVVFDPDRPQP